MLAKHGASVINISGRRKGMRARRNIVDQRVWVRQGRYAAVDKNAIIVPAG